MCWLGQTLGPRQISMLELFCEKHKSQKDVNYYCKKTPSKMFDRILICPAINFVKTDLQLNEVY